MLTTMVRFSLARPWLVLLIALVVSGYGVMVLARAQFEVFPEFVPAQASVQAEAPGMTSAQVEILITRPIENAINGATGVASVPKPHWSAPAPTKANISCSWAS